MRERSASAPRPHSTCLYSSARHVGASAIASSSKQHALSRTRSIGHLRSFLSSLSLCLAPRIASANPNPGIPPGPASARSETQTRTPTPQPHERPRARGTYACEIPIGFVEQHGACLQSQSRAGVAPAPVRSAPSAPSPLDSSCPISRAEIPSTARLNPPAKFRAASAVPRSAIGSITPMWTLIVDPLGSVEPLCTWLCHFPQHLCPAAPPPPPLLLPAHLACLGTWLVPVCLTRARATSNTAARRCERAFKRARPHHL